MAAPSVTYTLTNGTTADASQVMQNFNDLINGVSDGTKDLSVNALTAAGTLTANGSVTLGNASADDLTVNAALASSIPIKTTASYDIGSSTLGLRALYFGANSQTVNIVGSGSMSATWTMTLPTTAGTANYALLTNGSGVTSWTEVVNVTGAQTVAGAKTLTSKLTVQVAQGTDFAAEIKPTTAATPYGLRVLEPSGPSSGYPLLSVTDNAGSLEMLRVDSLSGRTTMKSKSNVNDYVAVVDVQNTSQPYGLQVKESSGGATGYPLLNVTNNGASTSYFRVDSGGALYMSPGTAGTATAGAATLPSNPVGYIVVIIAGTSRRIPYYAA